jgi:hypothetical protein
MKKKIVFMFAAAALMLATPPDANAGLFSFFGKKKKLEAAKAAKPEKKPQTPYEKLFSGKKVETAKSDFITLHKVQGKIYFEVPYKILGREMLAASTVTEVTSSIGGDVGYKPKGVSHVKFVMEDSTVYLLSINASVNPVEELKAGVSRIAGSPRIAGFPIKAVSKDSSGVVIEVTNLFAGTAKLFDASPSDMGSGLLKINAAFKKDESSLGEIKAFEDNISVKSTITYGLSASLLGQLKIVDDAPYTVKVTRSLLLLPEEKMRPRISDSRVGVFNHNKTRYSLEKDQAYAYSLAHRWRLVPKDVDAYRRGELVEPVKQIVWYVDNAFPKLWQPVIKEGVEAWNAAFEKIGFKNAIVAKPFPTAEQDSAFDPDNLKYSCIRYLPSGTANAYGPSWVDPTTGEIINASVIVYSNISQLINAWRFVQTAQIDERVRRAKMPDDVIKESLIYVISHEIGHTLGFMHNMASSSAWPVDSLRSATFTQKYGTTPCIMDYARFNYVAQPGDKGLKLTPPSIGVYDEFLIKWTYACLPDKKDEWDEAPVLESWVDERAGDPVYRYGRQQVRSSYDPTALTEDLGDDNIKAGEYGIKNLKYILANLETWIPEADDNDYEHINLLYSQIANQYARYLRNVSFNIGGIKLTEVKRGTNDVQYAVVPKARQKASLEWVLSEYRAMDWVDKPAFTKKLPLSISMSHKIRDVVVKALKAQIENLILAAQYTGNPYTVEEYTADLYSATWRSLISGGKPTAADKALQIAMVDEFVAPLIEKRQAASTALPSSLSSRSGYATVDDIVLYGLDETGVVAQYADLLREYEAANGLGSVAALMEQAGNSEFGKTGQGFQSKVNVKQIDDTNTYLTVLAIRSRDLLRGRIGALSGADRAHYQALLIKLNVALKDKL